MAKDYKQKPMDDLYDEIIEKYNTIKKEERIKNNRGIVQKQIVFPDKSIVKSNTDIGRMMDNITKY